MQYVYKLVTMYNYPDMRKNHYPDRFSPLCEKVKNYIEKNIWTMCNDETTADGGTVVNPLNIRKMLNRFGTPVCASLRGTAGGH